MHTIIIAEDHALLRNGLCALIAENDDLSVVGEAGDGLEAISLVQKNAPDLVLMDLSMPRFGGIEAIRQIKQIAPQTRILVVSMHATEKHLKAALQAGADGYLLKMAESTEFIVAIRSVLAGDGYISSKLAGRVLAVYSSRRDAEWSELNLLTDREKEILKLVAEGHTSKEVADILSISPKTADNHRANILRKLGLRNIHELTRFAREHDLVVE
ncbi:MAG TPA: response regulator transcription factor [Desulfomicrobiaceae bacterium]|nr:response regulator transcription factor [Desulfomicrobiaceae bacterium]